MHDVLSVPDWDHAINGSEVRADLANRASTTTTTTTTTTTSSSSRGSPRLLRSLKSKRDYLRTQFSQLQKNFTGFGLQRFQRSQQQHKDAEQRPLSGENGVGVGGGGGATRELWPVAEGRCAAGNGAVPAAKGRNVSGGCCAPVVHGGDSRLRATGGGDSHPCPCCGDSHPCPGGGDSHPRPGGHSHLRADAGDPAPRPGASRVRERVVVTRGAEDRTDGAVGRDGGDPLCLTGSAGGPGGRWLTMTVRGEGCMEDPHSGAGAGQSGAACGEHTHQHTSPGQRPAAARQGSHAFKRSSGSSASSKRLPSTSEFSEQDTDSLQEHSEFVDSAKATEADDELPLGSEANSLQQDGEGGGDGVVLQPPVDKRLLSLRQGLGGGTTGGGVCQLLHSGWTSFNSDVSNLTSGSATSASSVDWLLQERQVDPEQVLLNLGFGGGVPATTTMYARIPDRFLQSQDAEAQQDEDGTQEGAPAEGTPRRNLSRGASAWGRARTMSSAMLGLKVLSTLQQSTPLGLFSSPLGSMHGSASSLTTSSNRRSVLHPDNQRALARQGFYGDNLPEGIEPGDMPVRREGAGEDEEGGSRKSAEDRRKIFHKTRSKRQRSLVESGGEEGNIYSQDSAMKSVDFSTTTESTDSGELSTSAPTTPGDVFLDRAPSPRTASGVGGVVGPSFPVEHLTNIDDLYLPDKGSPNTSLTRSRQELTEKLMSDLDNDDNYFVSPTGTRQSTMEKTATMTELQAQRLEQELNSCDGDDGAGGGSQSSRTSSDEGGDSHHHSRTGSLNFDLNTKSVTIVVSEDGRSQRLSGSQTSQRGVDSRGAGSGGGVNFLSIVNTAMDRLSDSGSEHTLVDHQSSSSESPRPLSGSESPRPLTHSENQRPLSGSENTRLSSASVSPKPSTGSRSLEQGPVLYVYHKVSGGRRSPRDVNDNFQDSFAMQGENLHPHQGSLPNLDEDLPRMSSIQSDSSGFGDTEVSGDNAAQEMASLKVSSLGSSSESSATMASTCTVLGNSNYNHISNGFHHHTDTATTQTQTPSVQSFQDAHQQRSQSMDDLHSDSTSAQAGSGHRFITMCYIPNLNSKQAGGAPAHRAPVRALTSSSIPSSSLTEGKNILGKTQISVVFREKDKAGRGGRYGETSRGGVEEGEHLRRKKETSLSEELAVASLQGAQQSSTTRYSVSQAAMPSVPRLALTQATLDTSSVDGSRGGSCDELEQEGPDTPLSYTSWSRELPVPQPRQLHHHRHHHYPGVEGEDGEGGSGTSLEGSSVYSCASTSDSIGSSSSSELLDCHKLMKLINQPTIFKGQKTRLVHYRPKRHLRDWPGLLKKKKLQEETRLAQYAMQKFKTELSIMETSVMVKYQMAYEDMTREEREDVEELQHLWAEVRRQVMETEQLLTSRMKAVAGGNDNFSSLTSIRVLQRMMELLKEQLFQKQVAATEEEDEEEEEEEWDDRRRGVYRPRGFPRSYSSGSWAELPRTPRLRRPYSSSTSHLPISPAASDSSYEQFRSSLMSEVRQELRSSLQTLQQDLHKRDSEIHRLQLQMMEQRSKKPRSTQAWSRSLPGSSRRRRDVKETDV